MSQPLAKIHFPGLNGLRFIAAFLVIINHVETTKYHCSYANGMAYPFFTAIGGLSVTLFFVLSGFLITYLLLDEKHRTGAIHIKQFYFKRIVRIWPLYFLMVVLALFVLNRLDFFYVPNLSEQVYDHFEWKLFLYLLILPNVVAVVFTSIPYLHHVWSIGVEEQFYVIWPWIMRSTKNYLKVFLCIIFGMVILSAGLRFIANHMTAFTTNLAWIKLSQDINTCFSMLRMGCMCIGAIGAWLLFYKKDRVLQFVYRKEIQVVTCALLVVLFLINPAIPLIKHECYAVLYLILILNLASNRQSLLTLENKPLNYLGKISYGVYMYHPFVIGLIMGLLNLLEVKNIFLYNLVLYFLTISLTIGIAALSYVTIEKRWIEKVKSSH
ncbi:MAG: acyltransferase [Chitinophagaceae bacterium]|nr:acyltransferase [Chitinophagaceae bacterium]